MDNALGICVQLALTIYDMAKAAKTNKAQTNMLAERVKRLMEHVRRLDIAASSKVCWVECMCEVRVKCICEAKRRS